jgi:5-methylcytosine-specific restriction endonuclease McrA
LLQPLYKYKDDRRIFSQEQRRVIWNNDVTQKCVGCGQKLCWEDFTVDHMVAYIKGGRTRRENARLMCRECNSRKGSR